MITPLSSKEFDEWTSSLTKEQHLIFLRLQEDTNKEFSSSINSFLNDCESEWRENGSLSIELFRDMAKEHFGGLIK